VLAVNRKLGHAISKKLESKIHQHNLELMQVLGKQFDKFSQTEHGHEQDKTE
jgi:hypothetical protein